MVSILSQQYYNKINDAKSLSAHEQPPPSIVFFIFLYSFNTPNQFRDTFRSSVSDELIYEAIREVQKRSKENIVER